MNLRACSLVFDASWLTFGRFRFSGAARWVCAKCKTEKIGVLGPKKSFEFSPERRWLRSDKTSLVQTKGFESAALHCWLYSVWFTVKFIRSILLFGSLYEDFVCTLCFFLSIGLAPHTFGSSVGKMVDLFRWIQWPFKPPVRLVLLPTFSLKPTNLVSMHYLCTAPKRSFPHPAGRE